MIQSPLAQPMNTVYSELMSNSRQALFFFESGKTKDRRIIGRQGSGQDYFGVVSIPLKP
jgi:hypothetical protein